MTDEPKKPRKIRTSTAKTKETFTVRANVEFEISGPDKMVVQAMVLGAIAKLKFPGCVNRQVKWSGVYTAAERAALNRPKDNKGKFAPMET